VRYKLTIRPLEWVNGRVKWLDVTRLPFEEVYKESSSYEDVARAIERMEIRGAPAIGVAAALAIAAAVYNAAADSVDKLRELARRAAERLRRTRPTAVNLFWAINRMLRVVDSATSDPEEFRRRVVDEALSIMREDIEANMRMGELGSKLIDDGDVILTHCNTGALATAGFGTALGVIRAAWYEGKKIRVIATETRPVLQGARLTVWELAKEGIPVTLITDNMVGHVMSGGIVSKVFVGADRILGTGHVINKIGTYMIAIAAQRHRVPFYVVAPTSTIDLETPVDSVVIEERSPEEVRTVMGRPITLPDVDVMNPAFDITPPELVTAIVTEKGVIYPPYRENIAKVVKG